MVVDELAAMDQVQDCPPYLKVICGGSRAVQKAQVRTSDCLYAISVRVDRRIGIRKLFATEFVPRSIA